MSITELRPHLYRLVLGRWQAYLWHDDDSVTLIDTGEAGSGPAIAAALRQLHTRVAAGLPAAPPVPPAPPVRVDHEVRDGAVLDFTGGAPVISTPGHTDGSIALHLPNHQILITGDIAAEYQEDVLLSVFNLDRAVAASSFCRIAGLDVQAACFGHGEPVMEHASARLQQVASILATA